MEEVKVKSFKEAAKDLKENKGRSPEAVERKAKRVIDSRILEKEEQVTLAKLALRKAEANANVDSFKVEEATIQLESVKRSVAAAKTIEIEQLEERFDEVWGKDDVASIEQAFLLREKIKAVKSQDIAQDSKVLAAEARLNDLQEFPGVKDAKKLVKALEANVATLKEFREAAFGAPIAETPAEPTAE